MTASILKPAPNATSSLSEWLWFLTGCVSDEDPLRHISLNVARFQIGRHPNRHLRLPSPLVSNLHAEILVTSEVLILRDLNSTNGTYVNGRRVIDAVPIGEGDLLHFSDVEFHVGRLDSHRNSAANAGATMVCESPGWTSKITEFDRLLNERAVVPHYHPITSFETSSVDAFEILARSNIAGLRSPYEMFEVAEQLNHAQLLSSVCRWQGVAVGGCLPESSSLFMNTHPAENDMAALLDDMQQLRRRHPDRPLCLEMHEAAVTNPSSIRELRLGLDDLDIQLAYDDFGAGQARLLELIEVPPDYLKFDIELIRGIHSSSKQRQQFVGTLVSLTQALGIAALPSCVATPSSDARLLSPCDPAYCWKATWLRSAPRADCRG